MKDYLISTVLIILFISILELFIPNNKISGFVKTVIGIIVILVMLSPILNLFNYNFDLNYLGEDTEYSNYLAEYEKQVIKDEIIFLLNLEDIKVNEISIDGKVESGDFIIEKIYVKIDKEVINSDTEHINKLEKAKDLIKQRLYLNNAEVKVEY